MKTVVISFNPLRGYQHFSSIKINFVGSYSSAKVVLFVIRSEPVLELETTLDLGLMIHPTL